MTMERSERAGLGIAIVAHAALLAVLSLGLLTPKPVPKPVSDTIDIQFADEVGLVSGAPDPASEAPATSQAPETGKPEEAAAAASEPTPAPPEPRPTPPPAPKPSPTPVKTPTPPAPPPKPKPVPKPTPTPKPVQKPAPKPAPAPAKPSPAKPTPAKPAPAKAAADRVTPAKAAPARSAPAKSAAGSASDSAAKTGAGSGRKTAGAALGDDFLKGISPEKSDSKTQAPRAATVSANQMAGLVGAIQRQLLPCADRRSSPGPGSNRIVTRMRLQFRKDGSLASAPTVLGQTGTDDENARYATRVGELAIGIARECSPLKLPPELYQVGNGQGWNDIVIRYKLPG